MKAFLLDRLKVWVILHFFPGGTVDILNTVLVQTYKTVNCDSSSPFLSLTRDV